MRLRKVAGAKEKIENCKYVENNPKDNKGKWNKVFKNENPIHIEVRKGLILSHNIICFTK